MIHHEYLLVKAVNVDGTGEDLYDSFHSDLKSNIIDINPKNITFYIADKGINISSLTGLFHNYCIRDVLVDKGHNVTRVTVFYVRDKDRDSIDRSMQDKARKEFYI